VSAIDEQHTEYSSVAIIAIKQTFVPASKPQFTMKTPQLYIAAECDRVTAARDINQIKNIKSKLNKVVAQSLSDSPTSLAHASTNCVTTDQQLDQ